MKAIKETFCRRKTVLIKEHPLFTVEFYLVAARNKQWNAFFKRIGLAENLSFDTVMKRIYDFILPIYQAILQEEEFFNQWNARKVRGE